MLHFRPGSQLHRLVTLLSVAGEFPTRSLHLLGNERAYKELVHELTQPQTIRLYQTDTEMTCRLLTISGKGKNKSVRLYKAALPILEWLHPDAYRYYMDTFWNHKFPGDTAHRERNHRVAESVAMCMGVGIEFRPYLLPELQNAAILRLLPDNPVFYLGKNLKKIGLAEMNKTMFTRMVGAFFCENSCYAVYNTRESVMKWNGMGEFKTLHSLLEIGRLNAGITRVDSALLFGESDSVALNTMLESDKNKRTEFRFDFIYQHVHFVPMNHTGTKLLQILAVPDWNENLLQLLFEPDTRSYNRGSFEYDACVDGIYVLSHLDGDLARLVRFRNAMQNQKVQAEVLCYPSQVPFLREYLGRTASVKTIEIDAVVDALCPERRNLFE